METSNMRLVYAEIALIRGADLVLLQEGYLPEDQVRQVHVRAMVDSGATMLAIPTFIKQQLDLKHVSELEAELADGSSLKLEVVGSIKVRFQNRRTPVEAMVVPNSKTVLLGAIPMEGMDVLMEPKRERLIVNPSSPEMARMLLM
jgi:clan AA aspartic protease